MTPRENLRAFTLIETIVVIALMSIMMTALGSLLVYFYKTNAYVYQEAMATMLARRGIDDAVRYVRGASYGTTGSPPIQTAATSTITFSADVNDDQILEQVTYALSNGSFSRTVVGATALNKTLSTSVVNGTSTPVFRYFDTAGTELSAPINTANIASVTATLIVQAATGQNAKTFTLSGRAELRNSRL